MNVFNQDIEVSARVSAIVPLCAALIGSGLCFASFPAQSELTISGHVAYNAVDRDSEDDITFQRNGFSESRFKLAFSKVLENSMILEVVEEIGIDDGEGELDARRQEILLKGEFGGLRFGQGNDAGDGVLNGDLSGTAVIQPIASQSAALDYASADYNGFDPGRGERIRYDSPRIGDIGTVSVQLGNNDEIEIAFRYDAEVADGKLRVGAFLADTSSDIDSDSNGILVAYGLKNGISFALVTSSKDNTAGSEDGDFQAIKVGFETGPHAFSVISGTSENPGNAVETDSFGLAYLYMLDKGIEVYAAVNDFDSDDDSVDEDFVAFGTRVKF